MTAALIVHLPATVAGFWSWLVVHWPAAAGGCRFEFGHMRGQALRWVQVCHASGRLQRWVILVFPAGR
jgi:hypothetical protein